MAKQIITRLIDDIDGGEADETVEFALDGIRYTIDLSAKNAEELRRIFGPYVDNGTLAGTQARRVHPGRPEDTPAGRRRIRDWARTQPPFADLSERGRIPAEVIAAYRART